MMHTMKTKASHFLDSGFLNQKIPVETRCVRLHAEVPYTTECHTAFVICYRFYSLQNLFCSKEIRTVMRKD